MAFAFFKPPDHVEQKLDGDGLSRFRQLIVEYRTLSSNSGNKNARRIASKLSDDFETKKLALTQTDLNSLELALLQFKPGPRVRREAWVLRDRYRRVAGEKTYNAYISSLPPDPADRENEPILRADLEELLLQIHALESIIPGRERVRNWLSKLVGITLIVIFSIGLFVLYRFTAHPDNEALSPNSLSPTLAIALVIIAGATGGAVSMQRRLQSLSSDDTSFEPMRVGWIGVMFSMTSGGIFAMVLYLMFLGGLLQGPMFPRFWGVPPEAGAGQTVAPYQLSSFHQVNPNTMRDLGLLLIWSFLAGFAERLVPDALDRMTAKVQTADKAPLPATGSRASGNGSPRKSDDKSPQSEENG